MEQQRTPHLRLHKSDKSFYHLRLIVLLWAIFVSVLISYVTPVQAVEGYIPVSGAMAVNVKGASTQVSRVNEPARTGFIREEIVAEKFVPTRTPTPSPTPQPKADRPLADTNSSSLAGKKYDKSRQIGEYTWTIDVSDDDRAATADEVFQALNAYRQKNGKGSLQWSGKLADFASSRAGVFSSSGKTDGHAGFTDYINNQDGFTKLGFMKLGENSSYGYKVSGTKLIEEVYAGDSPHDSNQLGDWSHVGIGVSGLGTNLIFAANAM